MSSHFTIRKNVDSMTTDELANVRTAYRKVMMLPKNDNRGYQYYAGLHDYPGRYCWHDPKSFNGYPDVNLFLPWHRAYLYKFEKSLQDQVPGVTIPYWDWRTDNQQDQKIPNAFSTMADDQGNPNPLYKYRMVFPEIGVDRDTERFPGTQRNISLPTSEDASAIINDPNDTFFEFSEQLRTALHNLIHVWTGGMGKWSNGNFRNGDMAVTTFAAFDPIFWSHHCMVDKLWWMWQRQRGVDNIPNEWKDMVLEPFEMKVSDVLDIYQLGYDYGNDGSTVDGNWSGS